MVVIIAILNDGTFLPPLSTKEDEVKTTKSSNVVVLLDVNNRYHYDYIKGSCQTIAAA
jgi:hypothetical protein